MKYGHKRIQIIDFWSNFELIIQKTTLKGFFMLNTKNAKRGNLLNVVIQILDKLI